MAENVSITAGSGTVIATDDCSINSVAVQVQRVKAGWGADSVYNDPAVASPIPVQATQESSQIAMAGTMVTPLFVSINVNTNGNNILIAAVSAKKIRVLAYTLVCDAANTVTFTDGTGGTALTGAMSFAANGGVSAPYCLAGHFQGSTNTLLCINLLNAVGVRGHMTYITG